MYKRFWAALLCICTLLCCLPVSAVAADWNVNGQTWTLADGALTISGGSQDEPSRVARQNGLYDALPIPQGSALTPAAPGQQPDLSYSNAGWHCLFGDTGDPACSYLCENDQGGLTRIQRGSTYFTDDTFSDIVVEEFDKDFNLLGTVTLPQELPMWAYSTQASSTISWSLATITRRRTTTRKCCGPCSTTRAGTAWAM